MLQFFLFLKELYMKKLLLLALPFCLLTSFAVRAEEAVQPTEQVETTAPEIDPAIIAEYQKAAGDVFESCKDELISIQEKFSKGFASHQEMFDAIKTARPDLFVEQDGHVYFILNLGNIAVMIK